MASKRKTVKGTKKAKAWLDKAFENIVPSEAKVDEPIEDVDEDFIEIPDLPAAKPVDEQESNVVYIGHLPFGFEEFQLADFFKQFGEVCRAFVSRSPKTGRSRGYAFVEFTNATVARIACDTMNDYLMFKKRLICRMVPPLAARKIRWPAPIPGGAEGGGVVERSQFSVQRSSAILYNAKNKEEPVDRFIDREAKKKEKLQKLGINYEFDGYTSLVHKVKGTQQEPEKVKEVETKKAVVAEDDDTKKRKRAEEEAKTWEKRKIAKDAADMTTKKQKSAKSKNAYLAKKEKRLAKKQTSK